MIRVNNRLAFAAEPSVILGEPSGELTLKIKHGDNCYREVRVTSSKCSIGAAAGCTIELHEPGVQPVHCVILRGAGKTVVRRWAPNAWLNGQHFVDAVLNSGDELRIAGVSIQVFFDDASYLGQSPNPKRASVRSAANESRVDTATLSQLVDRLQQAEHRVHQLQTEVVQNRQSAESIVQQIHRVERIVRSDSAKKFQKVLDGLHEEKRALEQRLAALELRHQEERAAWQLELDRVAAELARQSESYRREEQKCLTQAARIAELESSSTAPPEPTARHARQLARVKKQLKQHRDELNRVQTELDLQQKRHLAHTKAFEEALSETQEDLQQTRDQLESKQNEVLAQQRNLNNLETTYAEEISKLEAALQQNTEKYDRLFGELELQRAAEREAICHRDARIAELEQQVWQRDEECVQLTSALEQARQSTRQTSEWKQRVEELEADLQGSIEEKAALQEELDRLRDGELAGLQQQIQQLLETLQTTRDEYDALQARLVETTSQEDVERGSSQEQIDFLAEQLNQSQAAVDELETRLAELQDERTRLTDQISGLESALSEREEACEQLQESLTSVDATKSSQECEFSARIADLEDQLQQQLDERQSLQSELETLRSERLAGSEQRVVELQQVLDDCQREQESLREELDRCQASAASQAEADRQRYLELTEEREQLAARCSALEAECAQLQQDRRAEQEAVLDLEHKGQLAQNRLDQQVAELRSELETRQTDWREREIGLQRTIEDLQCQLDELQSAASDHEPIQKFDPGQLERNGKHADGNSAVPLVDPQAADDEWSLEADATSLESGETPRDFETESSNRPLDLFETHEGQGGHADDADPFGNESDPFAEALNSMEVSISELQSEAAGQTDAGWQEATEPAVADDASSDFGGSSQLFTQQPEEEPGHAPSDDDDGQVMSEAESELLARIRALTAEPSPHDAADDAPIEMAAHDAADLESRGAAATSQEDRDEEEEEDEDQARAASEKEEAASHEMTIEDYMQRLLNRVGSSSSASPEVPQKTQTVVMGDKELSSPHRIETKKSSNPLSSSSNRDRTSSRPLTTVEIEAMRELANESTRTALSSHDRRSKEKAAVSTLGTAIIMVLGAAILLILSRGEVSLLLLAGVVTFAGACYFGYRAFRGGAITYLLAEKRKKAAKSSRRDPSTTAAGAESAATEPGQDLMSASSLEGHDPHEASA